MAEQIIQELDIILIEGVHFWNVHEYFQEMVESLSIFNLFLPQPQRMSVTEERLTNTKKLIENLFRCLEKQSNQIIYILESRHRDQNFIDFHFSEDRHAINDEKAFGVKIRLQIQENISADQIAKNFIKINILKNNSLRYIQIIFPQLAKLHRSSNIIKQNYCKFSKINEAVYPFKRYQSIKTDEQQTMILLLNQRNMNETDFFKGVIEELRRGGKHIQKIIGHPSSLFLTFLVDGSGGFDLEIGKALVYNKKLVMNRLNRIDSQEQLIRLRDIFLKVFKQQNILDNDFADFLISNIVTNEFAKNFIDIVATYYQIFANIQISKEQIQTAIDNNFYVAQQQSCQYLTHFSSIFKYIEFHHRSHYQTILTNISIVLNKKNILLQSFTLLDLYNYNHVQFTFVAFDIEDKVIRFFNHYTAPLMPITSIVSLIQMLPIPYKSITWQQGWGRYKIHYKNTLKQINITSHQIIDSRFLVECPLDLIESPTVRQCYFTSNGQNPRIHAISSTRIKFQELNHINQLKAGLKQMKNNAVDSIPKLRLLWKIITTKRLIDVDLDHIQSFSQIPVLDKMLKMDQTCKQYLQNFNRQAYDEVNIKTRVSIYKQNSPSVAEMVNSTRSLQHILAKLEQIYAEVVQKDEKDFEQSHRALEKIFKNSIVTNQQIQFGLSISSNILKSYRITGKYKYRQLITKIHEIMDNHDAFFCLEDIKAIIDTLITMFKACELRNRESFIQSQILNQTITLKKSNRESMTEKNENYPSQIVSIKQSLSIFSQVIEKYKNGKQTEVSIQSLRCEYEKLVFKLSYTIYNCFYEKKENQQIKEMYYQIFMVTPRLYYMSQIQNRQFFVDYQVKKLIGSSSQLHVVLSGKPNLLQHESSQLIKLRHFLRENKKTKITSITSTNHHALLAVLFCLQIKSYNLLEDVMGLQHLIRVNQDRINQQSINIIDFLLGNKSKESKVYSIADKKRDSQLRMRLIIKYQSVQAALSKLENLYKLNSEWYKIGDLYDLLQKYDLTEIESDLPFKQIMIIKYIQSLLTSEEETRKLKELLLENQQMLRQKIFLNKVGIKFILRLLFRDAQKQNNWMKIHTSAYRSIQIYRAYLQKIFKRYHLKQDVSLLEFDQTNGHSIQLNFVLANQSSQKYQLINSKTQPHLRLIEVILAAVSLPIEFSTFPLPTINIKDPSTLQAIVDKLQHKFTPRLHKNGYWSNYSLNSCPFSSINSKDQQLIRFQILTQIDEPFIHQSSRVPPTQKNQAKDTIRVIRPKQEVQDDKLRGTDIISLWWTKSQKLMPQIKKILFSNAENSPFVRYYFFLQNFSYEYFFEDFQKRSLINLYKSGESFQPYGKIIGNSILLSNNQLQRITFQLIKSVGSFDLQLIDSSGSQGMLIQIDSKIQRQAFKIHFEDKNQLHLNIFLFIRRVVRKLNIRIDITKLKQSKTFIEVVIDGQNEKQPLMINELIIGQNIQKRPFLSFKYEEARKRFTICSICRLIVMNNQNVDAMKGKCHICDKKVTKNKILCLLIEDQEQTQRQEEKHVSVLNQSLKRQENKPRSSWCFPCFGRR